MPAEIKPTAQLVGPTVLTTLVAAPEAGRVRRVDLTACNITAGAVAAAADVYILDANAPNSGYRKFGYPLPPPPDPDCAVILEYGLRLYEGQALQVRGSAADAAAFSAEVVDSENVFGLLATVQKVGTTAWDTIVAAPEVGKVRRVNLLALNVTNPATFAAASVQILDGANTGLRKPSFPVPAPPDPDCAVMLEYDLVLAAGQALQIKASANDAVAFSAEVVESDA